MNPSMTIGEAAARSRVPAKTLRFIHKAHVLGFSLREIESLLALYRDRQPHPRRAGGR